MKQNNKALYTLMVFSTFFVLHLSGCAADNSIKSNPAICSQEGKEILVFKLLLIVMDGKEVLKVIR
jgi:hypothetical protein